MNRTKIEWCDYTANPVKGKCPMGCEYCYMWGKSGIGMRFHFDQEIRLDQRAVTGIAKLPAGSRIFWGSTIDLFHDSIPWEYVQWVGGIVNSHPQLVHIFLTKCPHNLHKWAFLQGCWVGVTATNQESYYDGVSNIAGVEAKIKFVSFEPLLGQINGGECAEEYRLDSIEEFDWVIVGACTGTLKEMLALGLKDEFPDKRVLRWGNKWTLQPRIEWLREIVQAADKAGVKVFLKDNLNPLFEGRPTEDIVDMGFAMKHKTNASAWELRQELPSSTRRRI